MKILVTGLSVRAMAASAVEAGYDIIALDYFGDQDLRRLAESWSLRRNSSARYSAGALYQNACKLSYDAVAYTSNLENHPEILDRFAEDGTIIGNSPRVIRAVRCGAALFPRLGSAGFPVPRTFSAVKSNDPSPNSQWLIKPLLSGGGHGIRFFQDGHLPGPEYLIQEYIPGRSCSAAFVANGYDCVVLGITQQLMGMPQFGSQDFRYCGNLLILPEALSPELLNQVRKLTAFLTGEFGLTGVNGIDFMLHDGQVYPIEVNPRYSASMELIEEAYGLPVFDLHAQAALEGKLPDFKLESSMHETRGFAKGILFSDRRFILPDVDWPAGIARDISRPGVTLRKGDPVCTLLVCRPTPEEALAELIRQAGMLKQIIYA
jgi:uncharacterized protein